MIKTSMILGLSLVVLWGGASRGMPSLEVLDDDALGHVMEQTSDADLLPLRLVSKRVGAAATAELIRRGATFSMKTMTAADLPHLATFLKARETATTLTISDFQAGLFCQALMALRAEAHDFSFGSLRSLVVEKGYIPLADLNRFLSLLDMMPNLTSLDLQLNDIGDAGAQAIAGSPHLARLTSLNLRDNEIGAAGAQAIAGSSHLARLTSLNLEYNMIHAAGAQAIAASANMQHLTSLNLQAAAIGAAGAQAIAGSTNMKHLTALNLGCNTIDAAGAQAIAGSPHLVNLTSLDLNGNKNIGDAGAQAIAASANMQHLTALNLGYNNIRDAGAQAIAGSTNMQHLTSLNLRDNHITAAGVQAIAGSPHLVHLGPSREVYVWG